MASGPGSALERIRIAQAVLRQSQGLDDDPGRQLTRRALLQGAGAGAVALGLGGAWPTVAAAKPDGGSRVVIVGAGISGLGCAYRLWRDHGIRADVYEWSDRSGGRIQTLRGYFDDGQLVEEHAEFINPEHTATLHLARELGLTLDNTERYPPGINPDQTSFWFDGRLISQESVNRDWRQFGYDLFRRAAAGQAGRRPTATARPRPRSGIRCRSRSGSTPTCRVAHRATSVSCASPRSSMSTADPLRTPPP